MPSCLRALYGELSPLRHPPAPARAGRNAPVAQLPSNPSSLNALLDADVRLFNRVVFGLLRHCLPLARGPGLCPARQRRLA
ncbi:MAG: hypothetical protein WKG07_26540 [Hymenobacter sp.]